MAMTDAESSLHMLVFMQDEITELLHLLDHSPESELYLRASRVLKLASVETIHARHRVKREQASDESHLEVYPSQEKRCTRCGAH
jgi:hypothetical protein